MYAGGELDGMVGATITVGNDRSPTVYLELINGRHYSDALDLQPVHRLTGDGASIETIGQCTVNGRKCRVDLMTIDVPYDSRITPLRFRDLGTPASFIIFDVFYEYVPEVPCPFKNRNGNVALSELPSAIRVGDRLSVRRALEQLDDVILHSDTLDEAKAEALTFIAVAISSLIESGAHASLRNASLEAARSIDRLDDLKEVATEARAIVEQLCSVVAGAAVTPAAVIVDRALAIVNRNFAKDLTDSEVADQLNLSTSHFRYLFKEVTGQPFHKYLIALRLERARKLLMEASMPVREVALAVGFHGLAHFSRAFSQRFSISPTSLRRVAGAKVE